MNRVRDGSEVRKRNAGYHPLPSEDVDYAHRDEYRSSEDMLAREANFDAPGGSSNWPFIYRPPPDRPSSPSKERSPENGLLLSEESEEDKKFKQYYEKQVGEQFDARKFVTGRFALPI